MPKSFEQQGRENYETYRAHCLVESPYWEPIWHPEWDELDARSQASWVADARRDAGLAPEPEPKVVPFYKKFFLMRRRAAGGRA